MQYKVSLGDWERQKVGAGEIRHEVFIVEQKIPPDMEWDAMDAVCVHALACDESGVPLGTGRLLPDAHIGRMAVKKSMRGEGIGSALLRALMKAAAERGDSAVLLHAQLRAEAFYARFGFVREGGEFMEAGIPHILMRCLL